MSQKPADASQRCMLLTDTTQQAPRAVRAPDERVHHALVVAPPLDGQRGVRLRMTAGRLAEHSQLCSSHRTAAGHHDCAHNAATLAVVTRDA